MRNKLFALTAVALLMASMGVVMTPAASAAIGDVRIPGHTGDYVLDGKVQLDGTIRLNTLITGGVPRDVVIPSTYDGKRISSFTSTMFQGNPYISSLLIKAGGVEYIYDDSFKGCTALTSIAIEPGISELPYGAFRDCTALTSITIPGVTIIGGYVFAGCTALTSIIIPDSVTCIGTCAFRDCTSLTSVTIPDSVTWLQSRSFEGCAALTSVTIPDSVTNVGYDVFTDCTSLTSVKFQGDAPSVNDPPYVFAVNSPLTAYYTPGASGFTTPTWYGVPCKPLYTIVTFDSAGGSYIPTRQVAAGEALGSLPTPTKAGYTFLGWYDGTTKVSSSTVPTKDVTLKAQWSANNIQYTAPPTGNLAVGTYWSHQLSTTPGVVITVSGAGTSWLHVSGGTLSGVPPSPGVYEVSVLLTAPNHISQSKSFTLNVVPQLVLTNSPAAGAIAYVVG